MFNPFIMIQNFQIVGTIIMTVSVLMGIGLVLGSLFAFKRWGEVRGNMMMSQSVPITGPVVMLMCGSALLVLPAIISATLYSLWGVTNPLAYNSAGGGSDLLKAIVIFVRVMGVASMVRGIMQLSKCSNGHAQPGAFGKGMTHIFGGALCINIMGTYNILHYLFFGST